MHGFNYTNVYLQNKLNMKDLLFDNKNRLSLTNEAFETFT
jgi:hypothetical protein